MRRKLLIAGLLLLLGAKCALALTLSDVRSQIRRNVRDTASSSTARRYSDATLLVYINEAQRAVMNDTWSLSTVGSVSSVAGTASYSLPAGAIKTWRVTYDSVALPEVTMHQLDADNPGIWYTDTSATPTNFYFDPSNADSFNLYPIPTASGSSSRFGPKKS